MFMLFILLPFSVAAQETLSWDDEDFLYYERGNQNFSFAAGTKLPLFTYFPVTNETDTEKFTFAGWYGSIGWERFLSSSFALGGELAYSSNGIVNGRRLVQVPVMFTARWYTLQNQFDIPLTLKAGGVFNSLNDEGDQAYLGPILAPSVEFLWKALDAWSFGIEASYWFTPEFYFGDKRDQTAIGNFLTIAVTATFTNRD